MVRDILASAGCLLVVSGLWMIHPGYAIAAAGSVVLLLAVLWEVWERPPGGGGV